MQTIRVAMSGAAAATAFAEFMKPQAQARSTKVQPAVSNSCAGIAPKNTSSKA